MFGIDKEIIHDTLALGVRAVSALEKMATGLHEMGETAKLQRRVLEAHIHVQQPVPDAAAMPLASVTGIAGRTFQRPRSVGEAGDQPPRVAGGGNPGGPGAAG